MHDTRLSKRAYVWIAMWAVIPLLTACGGGDDDFAITCGGHSCISDAGGGDSGVRYAMEQCEIYYIDGSGWQECGYNGTPGFAIRVAGFTDLDACYDMINTLKANVSEIYDGTAEDQWRGYATLLWCH